MVQVWYPAEFSGAPLAPYRRWDEVTKLSSYVGVLKTHSHRDAPVSKGGALFPVLIFNPAWKNQRTQNTFQTEDLASHVLKGTTEPILAPAQKPFPEATLDVWKATADSAN
jgi:hypothetical protein